MRTATLALIACTFVLGSAIPLGAQDLASYLVSWAPNPEPGIASYIVYRSTNPSDLNPPAIDTVNASTTSFIDSNALKGTAYYYWVRAVDGSGRSSDLSNVVSGITIPQNASEGMKNLCRITQKTKTGNTSFDISWTTALATLGFVQYDRDAASLDSASAWDEGTYATSHTVPIGGLLSPNTYYVRAVAYDNSDNMFISAVDTFLVENEPPQPLSAPHIGIYPVPYRPTSGALSLTDLPAGGSVTILNGSGIEVWSTTVGTETSLSWNGMNNQGSPAASGVYFAVVKDAKGAVVLRRPIMIVR